MKKEITFKVDDFTVTLRRSEENFTEEEERERLTKFVECYAKLINRFVESEIAELRKMVEEYKKFN